jgi:hypothetical protein
VNLARLHAEAAPEKRAKRRQRVFLAGKLAYGGSFVTDCTIRDLSNVGARIHAPAVIGLPDEVSLLILREGLVVRSKRVWARAPLFGLKFVEAEDVQTGTRAQHAALRRLWTEWVAQQKS